MPFGEPRIEVDRCESTQLLLDASLPEGAIAVADEQTAGRGRLGRTWEAPAGRGILCSVLLKPPALRQAPEVALVAGVAVAEALEASTGLRLGIKWPNDVLLRREKLAGILAEARDGAVVLGFGINVNQTAAELPAGATSLAVATGRQWARDELLAAVLAALERRYRGWVGGGLTAVREELAARDVLGGRPLRLDGREGVGAGIDGSGRLLVDVGDGEPLAVESGVVELSR